MKTILNIKEKTDNSFIRHIITVEEGAVGGGWYQQMTSQSSFLHRVLNRWYDSWHTKKSNKFETSIMFSRFDDFETNLPDFRRRLIDKGIVSVEDALIIYPDPYIIYHDSIWKFYKYIGYNYKNRKVSHIDKFINIKRKNMLQS